MEKIIKAKETKSKSRDEKVSELKGMDREVGEFRTTREKQLQEQSGRMRQGIVDDIVKIVNDQVKAAGGESAGHPEWWGKRRFAYEINHRTEGYYVVLQAKADPPAMQELHRVLSLADEVVRHKVLQIPERVYGPPKTASAGATDA